MTDCDLYFSSTNLGVGLLFCDKDTITMQFFDHLNKLEYEYSIKK